MSDLEFLRAVRVRLGTHGWHKGWLGKDEGPNCVLGAVVLVMRGEGFKGSPEVLREHVIGYDTSIGSWNDSRTEAEVFAALDDAIARLEEMEAGTTPEVTPEPVLI